MKVFQLVDQGGRQLHNIVLKNGVNNVGRTELHNLIKEKTLCELITSDDQVDVVNVMLNAEIYINSRPVSRTNSELKVGDILGIGSNVTVEQYKELGGEVWEKTKLFKLEELIPDDGGNISDEEYNSDDTETFVERVSVSTEEIVSLSEEFEEEKPVRESPEIIPAIPTPPPVQNDDESDFDPHYEAENEGDMKFPVPILYDGTVVILSSSESDEPDLPCSPIGSKIYKISHDPKNPTFPPGEQTGYEVSYPPTPPSSENEKSKAGHGRSRNTRKPSKSSSSDDLDKTKENQTAKKRVKRNSNKTKRDQSNKRRRILTSDESEEEDLTYTAKKLPEKPLKPENNKTDTNTEKSPLKVDQNRFGQNKRAIKVIEPQESPFKSHKGHKAPPLIPVTPNPVKKNPPLNIKQIEAQYKEKFSKNPKAKTVKEMREKHASIKEKLAELEQNKPNSMPKVKCSVRSRNDSLFEEISKPKKPPNKKTTNKLDPKPGPSWEYNNS